jgi:flagellar hook-length control protein FliK
MGTNAAGLLFGMVLAQLAQGQTSQGKAEVKLDPQHPTAAGPTAEETSLAAAMLIALNTPTNENPTTPATAANPSLPNQTPIQGLLLTPIGEGSEKPNPLAGHVGKNLGENGKDMDAAFSTELSAMTADVPADALQLLAEPKTMEKPVISSRTPATIPVALTPVMTDSTSAAGSPSVIRSADAPQAVLQHNLSLKSDGPETSQLSVNMADNPFWGKREENSQSRLDLSHTATARLTADALMPEGEKAAAQFVMPPPLASDHPVDAAPALSKIVSLPNVQLPVVAPREILHLQLEPPELGRLTLQVSVQAQQVQAAIGVEHRGLGEFLVASQGALDDALRQHGLRMEEFHVETIANADVAGLGAGRTGLLDQGAARQDASESHRQELRLNAPDISISDLDRTESTDHFVSRYRINIFA